jgi:hypothetical protein
MMKFDSSQAWREALAAVQANREVLLTLGGVFFLLPGLVATLMLSDLQEQLIASFGSPAATERLMQGQWGKFAGIGLLSFVVQTVGYASVLALLTDSDRPTVGQALRIAVRALPVAIGAALLFFCAYMLATGLFAAVAAILGKLSGLAILVAILVAIFVCLLVAALVRVSLTLPVIIMDKVFNPMAALMRSWHLTKGHALGILLFYIVLLVVYLVIILLLGGGISALAVLLLGKGTVALWVSALASGVLGALASVLFSAVLAAIHRQLAGSSTALTGTFE